MKSMKRNEDAFTGLEAAIVLIAFVVVAAVFSYVVLGAGFFTTQKSQETVHTAVAQASSAVEILGNVYGETPIAGQNISIINFTLGLASGGTPVDMNKTVMTISTGTDVETLKFAGAADNNIGISTSVGTGYWGIIAQQNSITNPSNKVLDNGEQFTILAMPSKQLAPYTSFTLDIKPPVGAALSIHRTVPAYTEKVNLLY